MKVVRVCKCMLKGPHRLIVLLSQPHIIKVLLLPWNFQGNNITLFQVGSRLVDTRREVLWYLIQVRRTGMGDTTVSLSFLDRS